MQRQVLQAVCRPGHPDALRAVRISFQTVSRAVMSGIARAADRNRTAHGVADRLDGLSHARHDVPDSARLRASRRPALPHRHACTSWHRTRAGQRIASRASAVRPRFRMRTPSRGCDACRTQQPVSDRVSHPAPRRATRAIPIRPATLAERARAA
ncbi:hypothetical protein BX604_1618 [Burkholderia sp. JKS000303]|nr:hypothetical protein BX604_1618 [Burkholderia sp. JKS000303]